jgi:glycosyltransferase involved in cell wall biosynthesis
MAAGLPIVASAIDGSMEIIEDQVNGRLFPPGDHSAMAQAIMDLIEDPETANKMMLKGQKTVREFDVNLMVDQIADLYLEMLKKNREPLPDLHAESKEPILAK